MVFFSLKKLPHLVIVEINRTRKIEVKSNLCAVRQNSTDFLEQRKLKMKQNNN